MAERELVRCRDCNRLVFWVTTLKGKRIALEPRPKPFEPPPAKRPNVILELDGRARVLSRAELDDVALEPRFLAHWANCGAAFRAKALPAARERIRAKVRAQRLEAEDQELDQLRAGESARG